MKKNFKKFLALMVALALIFSYVPESAYAASHMTTETEDAAEEATVNAEVYFVNYATKKIITLDGTEGNPIDCYTMYDPNNIPENALFKIYYATATAGDLVTGSTVVNFTNAATKTSWKSDETNVYQISNNPNGTKPNGWESVRLVPNGDGTVSFKSSAVNKYFTVSNDTLQLSDTYEVSPNEKFVIHTEQTPKTAKKVKIVNVAGDTLTVSWSGIDECLYCGYEVLYSTSENGKYISAGQTASTSMVINGLSLNTTYYFKVRTLTNNEGGAYADSKIVYGTTLDDYKPSKPENIKVEEANGTLKVSWDASNSAKTYDVYRADSRYATYEKIATTTANHFEYKISNGSKYLNYFKVQPSNNGVIGEFSDVTSLEMCMFGKNTYIFNETDNPDEIDNLTNSIFEKQHYNQFGKARYALVYKPGNYTDTSTINVGYYTQILGLGKTPYDVELNNVMAPAALSGGNATCNFWVGIENVTIKDTTGKGADSDIWWESFKWAVSQAAPARRLNVERKALFQWTWDWTAWSSGGFISDSVFHQQTGSFTQQQYYYRNCELLGGVFGVNWNQVIQGCEGVTAETSSDGSGKGLANMVDLISKEGTTNWNQRGCTTIIDETSVIREKPFLYFDEEADEYKVFVPALRENSTGVSWSENNMGEGASLSVDKSFYIAKAGVDTAKTINKQLACGKNIIFTPGIYYVDEPINVTSPNTILLGMGMATVIPTNNEAAIKTADVSGLAICGLILDAGNYSKTLLTVGEEGCNKDHSENPIVLQDVIYRVGGTGSLGRVDSCQVINSNDVIIDHTWIWRADHGDNVGWNMNTAKNGLVVNGDNVTAYGLFCEHFQEYDIIWRGEYGKTYFLQNEKCYDPQKQEEWMSHDGTKKGYAAYKVTNNVKNHYAVGLGVYDVFINTNGASIYLDNAIEVPNTPGVLIENACIVEIANESGPQVGINHIINNTTAGIRTGADNNGGYAIQRLLSYNNEESLSLPDYYTAENSTEVKEETGETPNNDVYAEKDIIKDAYSKDTTYPTTKLWEMTDKDYDEKYDYYYDIWLKNNPETPSNNNQNGGNKEETTLSPEEEARLMKAPRKVTIKKIKKKKLSAKKVSLTIKKVHGATGYQIEIYKTKKNAKKGKKVLVKATSKKIKINIKNKKLKNKKKLFVKVRAYVDVRGYLKTGKWSKIKRIKIKK